MSEMLLEAWIAFMSEEQSGKNMSRRDTEKDLERPHYYSQYWINLAREGGEGGAGPVALTAIDEEDDLAPPVAATKTAPRAAQPVKPLEADLEELPLPRTPAKPAKQKPVEKKESALTSFADLATLGFGEDVEMDELPVGGDADDEEIMSRLGANFADDVEPDEEEAASLEALSEDEDWDEDEDEEDIGSLRRPARKPPQRPRRPERPAF